MVLSHKMFPFVCLACIKRVLLTCKKRLRLFIYLFFLSLFIPLQEGAEVDQEVVLVEGEEGNNPTLNFFHPCINFISLSYAYVFQCE